MILSKYYNYSLDDFVDLYKNIYKPPNVTLKSFKNNLSRIEKIYKKKIKDLNLEFIDNINDVIKKLEENTYSQNTIYSTVATISKIATIIDSPLSTINVIRKKLFDIREQKKEIEIKNRKTIKESENWIDLDKILEKLDEFMDLYLSGKMKKNEFIGFLLLNLFTRQPPVRIGNYLTCLVKREEYNADENYNKNYNYLFIHENTYIFVFYKYKTAKFYGEKIQLIEDEKINELLDLYFMEYNDLDENKYFLISNEGSELIQTHVTKILKHITEKLFSKSFSIDLIRHIYITSFLNKNPSLKNKLELASEMNHSLYLQNIYNKI